MFSKFIVYDLIKSAEYPRNGSKQIFGTKRAEIVGITLTKVHTNVFLNLSYKAKTTNKAN